MPGPTSFSGSLAEFQNLIGQLEENAGEAISAVNENTKKAGNLMRDLAAAKNGGEVTTALNAATVSENPFIDTDSAETITKYAGDFEEGSSLYTAANMTAQRAVEEGMEAGKQLLDVFRKIEQKHDQAIKVADERSRNFEQANRN